MIERRVGTILGMTGTTLAAATSGIMPDPPARRAIPRRISRHQYKDYVPLHFLCWVCLVEADIPRGINNQKVGPIKVPVRNPWSQPHKQKNAALLISLWLLATEKQNKLVPVRMRGMPRCLHARRCVEDVASHGAGGYRPRGLDAVPEVVAVGGWVADVTERLLHSLPHGAAFFRCCGDYFVDELRVLLEGAEGRSLGESRGGVRRFGHVDGFGVVGYDRGRFLG
ncbi:uncharacterized protein LY79DRAFT_319785 [Colletotrichum navitas]|uniref:Uncharacterized protein n=1 Tax=Colletotrichum navitas TaxID=681940 RepID=A0AAD8Q914_9PEZI|nr:uncharacterized protein LY79DRAFT_319785 [Colletotrichum navitas]KAK1597849.1 hypothetical protein LY79DRAFT_319785 [Colletotrichum navitas]